MSPKVSAAAPDALFVPFTSGELAWPAGREVAFLGARDCAGLHAARQVVAWHLEQPFKPRVDALARAGWRVSDSLHDDATRACFPLVLVLPPRQRDAARALFARALSLAAPGGMVAASMANNEGARSGEADLGRLAGSVASLSKHKCRVFWTLPDRDVDRDLHADWSALDAIRPIGDARFVSRPGLFSWDRIDPASALLAEQLPDTLAGRVADLGAGFGYLATEVLRRCADVRSIDLYEAEALALEPARINCANALAERGDDVAIDVRWHDVTTGLPRRYDAIVSNPPFHQGRADEPQLGRAFIAAAARALDGEGSLWMVANRHLAYEATLADCFAHVRVVVVRDGFKVIEASGGRT
jgi:16S rRNA (guanine1207-N2)-methyltransferase